MILYNKKIGIKMKNNNISENNDFSASKEKLIDDWQCKILNTMKDRQNRGYGVLSRIYFDIAVKLAFSNWNNKIITDYKKILRYCDCDSRKAETGQLENIPFTIMTRVANKIKERISVEELEKFRRKIDFISNSLELLFKNLN